MASVWDEDQADLLGFSLRNIFESFRDIKRYKSNKYFIAVPFDIGYRSFDVEAFQLEEILFKASEILKTTEFDRVNIETDEGIPILTMHIEVGPTIVITDILTDKTLCNISL
ncbi:MAG: hypothetical protein ACTSW1_11105 [Candidatus Hodarchaeales archaeon]